MRQLGLMHLVHQLLILVRAHRCADENAPLQHGADKQQTVFPSQYATPSQRLDSRGFARRRKRELGESCRRWRGTREQDGEQRPAVHRSVTRDDERL